MPLEGEPRESPPCCATDGAKRGSLMEARLASFPARPNFHHLPDTPDPGAARVA